MQNTKPRGNNFPPAIQMSYFYCPGQVQTEKAPSTNPSPIVAILSLHTGAALHRTTTTDVIFFLFHFGANQPFFSGYLVSISYESF
jgi:hypothetical protein